MITDDEIRRVVSHRAFEAGARYFAEGRVHALSAAPDGTTLWARVRGSGRSIYQQTILWRPGAAGRLFPSGSCTCPVGINCKHVAAVLLAYREEASKAPAGSTRAGRQPQQRFWNVPPIPAP